MKRIFIFFAMTFILFVQFSWGQVPKTISYQGILTDANGNIIPNGSYSLTFKLYETDSGGVEVWTETQPSVLIANGIFNVILGSATPLTLSFDRQYWLGITVGIGTELTPRIKLTSSPYSLGTREVFGDSNIIPANGNVGIGTLSPAKKLDVLGTVKMTGFEMPTGALQGSALISDSSGNGTWQSLQTISPHNTLDKAYDQGGAGTGRTITADSGSVDITVPGVGNSALIGSITNAGSAKNAIIGSTLGTNSGVYGSSGIPPNLVRIAGVSGESKDQHGVAGYSENTDGVYGRTNKVGTFYGAGDPKKVVGGVHGVPALASDNGDNFAVVGTQGSYSSTGVLGIGGEKGHGVLGIPGGHSSFTTAGVRGITREGTDGTRGGWPPAFPLEENISKEMVGVLGQAYKFTGVWGESVEKFGVVGNTGDPIAFTNLPNDPSGVYGTASQNEAQGVHGVSQNGTGVLGESKAADGSEAGVRAVGFGVTGPGVPSAAALEIRNGAIRVSGGSRPAGSVSVVANWGPVYSAMYNCPPDCNHNHLIGFHSVVTLLNDLIVGGLDGSVILLTVEAPLTYGIYAMIFAKRNGAADIMLVSVGDIPPPPASAGIKLNYLIINQAPQEQ